MPSLAKRIFLSYAREDERYRVDLQKHLATLVRQGKVVLWHDRILAAGEGWQGVIAEQLDRADIVLLLLSHEFLDTGYAHDVEMARAFALEAEGRLTVIPVVLRPCDWKHPPLSERVALPTDGTPVDQWTHRDAAFLDVVESLRRTIERLEIEQAPAAATSPGASRPHPPPRLTVRTAPRFSDQEKDAFLAAAFAKISGAFRDAVADLPREHHDLAGTFEQVDGRRFHATIYRAGALATRCAVFLGGISPITPGIGFSYDATMTNGFNENLRVEVVENMLKLVSLGMPRLGGHGGEAPMDPDEAAALFWRAFVAHIERS